MPDGVRWILQRIIIEGSCGFGGDLKSRFLSVINSSSKNTRWELLGGHSYTVFAVSKIQHWFQTSWTVYTDYWVLTRLQVSQLHDHKHTHIYIFIYTKRATLKTYTYVCTGMQVHGSFFHTSCSLSMVRNSLPGSKSDHGSVAWLWSVSSPSRLHGLLSHYWVCISVTREEEEEGFGMGGRGRKGGMF